MPNPTKGDWKWWITTGIVILGLIAGAAWKLKDELSKIDRRIARVETAVRIIGAKQGGDTKTLIDEALGVAKKTSDAGRTESAKAVLDIANRLLAEEKASRAQAPQEFFDSTIKKYQKLRQSPALADSVWEGTTKLIEYRSTITAMPPGFSRVYIGQLSSRGNFRYLKDSLISGQNAVAFGEERGFVLDGFYLENVVFQNVRIIYHGGPVILQGVHFVNCEFDVAKSPRSERLLEATIKQPVNVAIG